MGGKGLVEDIEKRFGLPRLSKFVDSFERFPDAKQLKLLKEILDVAERLSKTAPDLDKVATLVRELNAVPLEKLEKLETGLKHLEQIIEKAPQDLLDVISRLLKEE